MPTEDHSDDEAVLIVNPSKEKSKEKSKPKSKSIKVKEHKAEEEQTASGGQWNHSNTLYVIEEVKHQMELGKGNDGGLKSEGWKLVLNNYNSKYKVKEPLSRLKNHIQKLKTTFKAFVKIMDSSGAPGVNIVTGEVHADKDWWNQWIVMSGNKDAKPIRNNGFPAYQAMLSIMPDKRLRANGNEGFGTQSKKKKVVTPPLQDDSDKDQEAHISSDNGSPQDRSDGDPPHASDSPKDSDRDDIKGKQVASSQKKMPVSRIKSKYQLTAAEMALDPDSDDDTPERKFVRSKRSPVGASTSTAKRSRISGPKLVAESISKAVDRVTSLEEKNDSDKVAVAKIKTEQHPMRQEAMAIFNKECSKNLKPQHIIKVANELKKDDSASFFYYMDSAHRWNWLKDEANVLHEYQDIQEDD